MEQDPFSKLLKTDSIRNFQLPTDEDDPVDYISNSKVEGSCGYSYSKLLNRDSIRNFQLPKDEDDPVNHTNSSSVNCTENKGFEPMIEHESGSNTERPSNLPSQVTLKRKRNKDEAEVGCDASECNDADGDVEISEEYYRTMLENHARTYAYKRARLEEAASSRSLTVGDAAHELRINSDLDVAVDYVLDQFPLSTPGLHIAANKPIQNPAIYDHLSSSQNFKHFPNPQTNNFHPEKFGFPLETSPAQPDTVSIERFLVFEAGTSQLRSVKVLEKAYGYEVIEHNVLEKLSIQEYPNVIVRNGAEKIKEEWTNIVKRDLPKHQKSFLTYHKKKSYDAKKVADYCQKEVKSRSILSLKMVKAKVACARKLAKDMLLFWKLVDKEEAERRKKEEREAAEAYKREEKVREERRQQQRLNFLLSQTELYSHFMQNKTSSQPIAGASIDEEDIARESYDVTLTNDKDIEEVALKEKSLRIAQNAASQQKKITTAFDSECLKFQNMGANGLSQDGIAEGSHNMDLLNPSSMPQTSSVPTPNLFKGILKEYQLKGLQWLVNCYEYGLNGILADEMGLGKTIQAIAFLAHLAEVKNIWGPFLVVAPTSVLNNWVDEINNFCPDLNVIPYWGGLQERIILRKKINPKQLYRRESSFHIVITSYQLVVVDEKYLRRVKWQYMILDEAQAIKSAYSLRWKALLNFKCRNRLLLTGTPIQNNMAELWALLHFIMPTLFDSHEQFDEWFSKGIENHAEHGGALNEHQLNRLHAILKPFMLRRVKKDVITEMTNKKEVTVSCTLSSRQQAFYRAIKSKISVAELFDSIQGHPSKGNVCNLINIVMQLRKVCNHPDLFERNEGRTFLHFGRIPNSLLPPPFGELEEIHYAGSRNPISYKVPKLIYREGIQSLPTSCTGSAQGFQQKWLDNLLNVFSPQHVHRSVFPPEADSLGSVLPVKSGTFGFSRMIDMSPGEIVFFAKASDMERLLFSCMAQDLQILNEIIDVFLESEENRFQYDRMPEGKVRAVTRMLMLPTRAKLILLKTKHATGPENAPYEELVVSHHDRFLNNVALLKAIYSFIPPVRAPPVDVVCPDRGFAYQRAEELHHPWFKKLLVGFARTSQFNGPAIPQDPQHLIQEIDSELFNQKPVLDLTNRIFGSSPPLKHVDIAKLLRDSGKLQTLDALLKRLFAQNHRVLLFAQMTKMLDILEDYMNYRKYKFLRLDGSSTIKNRHDMVRDFQNRQDIFIFMLSTRAGGVGINLTAADTVIFYESDWNPTLDLQAMDRAHRLGQTKEVTVYRLICKQTVEEKILQRANKKIIVQQLVMQEGNAHSDAWAPDDVVSLLLDDSELEQRLKVQLSVQGKESQLKRKRTVWFDAEGNASLEDSNLLSRETEIEESRKGKGRKVKSKRTLNQLDTEGNAALEDSTNPLTGETTELEGSRKGKGNVGRKVPSEAKR